MEGGERWREGGQIIYKLAMQGIETLPKSVSACVHVWVCGCACACVCGMMGTYNVCMDSASTDHNKEC